MSDSTHKVVVIPVVLQPHLNADSLSVIPIHGYTYVGKTAEWQSVSRAAFIPPDNLVDVTRSEFSFLSAETRYDATGAKDPKGSYALIKVRKLRGVISYGLLVKVDEATPIGTDLTEQLGVAHYEPATQITQGKVGGDVVAAPPLPAPKYDVESFQRYAKDVFKEGELVSLSEKIHGANCRFVYSSVKQQIYVGSHTEWKKEFSSSFPGEVDFEEMRAKMIARGRTEEQIVESIAKVKEKQSNPKMIQSMFWQVFHQYPELKDFLLRHPDTVVYGEAYGQVQDLKYGAKPGEINLAVFDIFKDAVWVNVNEARKMANMLPWVPLVRTEMKFNFEECVALAEGNSLMPGAENQIKEGVVVRPLIERWDSEVGRVQLKIVSEAYYNRRKK